MTTKIQILRNVGTTAVAVPTLLEGELAYAKGGFVGGAAANGLVVGDGTAAQVLIGSDRQVELTGNQTIASGTKTFAAGAKLAVAIADLLVSGGAAGDTIVTDGAGNLTFGAASGPSNTGDGTTIIDNGDGTLSVAVGGIADGVTIIDSSGKLAVNKAVTADVEAGTANKFVDTALLKTDVLGGGLSTLTTTAKTLVPAINEIYSGIAALSGGVIFAGTVDATTGDITPASNVANVPANVADIDPALTKNYFWIVTVAGDVTGVAGSSAQKQDWIASDGVKLAVLHFGPQTVIAADVAYMTPAKSTRAVLTATDVQAALDEIDVILAQPIDGGTF
jgi:hypothetical protein